MKQTFLPALAAVALLAFPALASDQPDTPDALAPAGEVSVTVTPTGDGAAAAEEAAEAAAVTAEEPWRACPEGVSPVDLPKDGVATTSQRPYLIKYGYAVFGGHQSVTVHNKGDNLYVDFGKSDLVLNLNDRRYQLVSAHFHTPSEHLIGGQQFAGEIHFVHKEKDGEGTAVVAVMVKEGTPHSTLGKVFSNPPDEGKKRTVRISLGKLFPFSKSAYLYQGSSTTEPCIDGVSWLVLPDPLTMSRQQLEVFETRFGPNASATFPVEGRDILFVE